MMPALLIEAKMIYWETLKSRNVNEEKKECLTAIIDCNDSNEFPFRECNESKSASFISSKLKCILEFGYFEAKLLKK